jgi:hypothetical protein
MGTLTGPENVNRPIPIYWYPEYPQPENKYVLLALELKPGQSSQDVILGINSLGTELALRPAWKDNWGPLLGSALAPAVAPFAILFFPIWFPMLVYDGFFRAQKRPFDGCCFVWITDVATGETVAGESPPGMMLVLPQMKPDQLENGKISVPKGDQ